MLDVRCEQPIVDTHSFSRIAAPAARNRHDGGVDGFRENGLSLRSARGRWVVLAATLGSAIALLDGTVVNVALRPIGLDLGASLQQLQWVVNAYMRSEEHTSELQSRGHLVCRLLLEKKNNKHIY